MPNQFTGEPTWWEKEMERQEKLSRADQERIAVLEIRLEEAVALLRASKRESRFGPSGGGDPAHWYIAKDEYKKRRMAFINA